jgi:hypothetical protein
MKFKNIINYPGWLNRIPSAIAGPITPTTFGPMAGTGIEWLCQLSPVGILA